MSVKVLYILSSRHSGSTILGNLLGELDGFFQAGDLRALWRRGLIEGRRCGCGVPVPECEVWSAVAKGVLEDENGGLDPRQVVGWMGEAIRAEHTARLMRMTPDTVSGWPALDAYVRVATRLYRETARVTGARVVVEASKQQADVALLQLLPGIQPYLVHLVRDPRAVDYSWRRRSASLDDDGRPTKRPLFPGVSARGWVAKNREAASMGRRLGPGRSLLVRYEDFVANPRATLQAVAELVEERPSRLPLLDERTALLRTNHTAAGNRNRFQVGEVRLALDSEWKTRQSRKDRWLATALAFPMLRRYGYPVRVDRELGLADPART